MSESDKPAVTGEKIQKILARSGVGSRREIERMIEQGQISVNGKVATLGDRINGDERVKVSGHLVAVRSQVGFRRRVLVYHKPEGEVCTRRDEQGRRTIFSSLPKISNGRWINVGRLDLNTSGLLLVTNDGELANRLMHPSHEVERVYAVRVYGEVDDEMIARLQKGVELEDGPAAFEAIVEAGGESRNRWFHVSLREGRNREVRRLWESQGVKVSRLIRIRYAGMDLPPGLKNGQYSEMEAPDVERMAVSVGLQKSSAPVAGVGQRAPSRSRSNSRVNNTRPAARSNSGRPKRK
ncbi:23S rRNA pseudouridine(2605) synthase RluB [Pelagibaculum spongiae]|uniref:Pseudouridine synthase n=1 Tax=Pelagibaculum spongiae TaxID=2080658 RepID=A0A2V1GZM8_9GAMM|nr:23S rRNA pseudouridine(2605) synthase RluB [Pelagibaculum spongiae]PVZ71643.1 23S rRNA pseudouridine(2605) synthase RluB [Pelagibaculum spongiae]